MLAAPCSSTFGVTDGPVVAKELALVLGTCAVAKEKTREKTMKAAKKNLESWFTSDVVLQSGAIALLLQSPTEEVRDDFPTEEASMPSGSIASVEQAPVVCMQIPEDPRFSKEPSDLHQPVLGTDGCHSAAIPCEQPPTTDLLVDGREVFDISRPETYLEWLYLTLKRIPISALDSSEAVEVLLLGAPSVEVQQIERMKKPPQEKLQLILEFLHDNFFTTEAMEYVLHEEVAEQDETRKKRLLEIKRTFIDPPDRERRKMIAYIDALEDPEILCAARAMLLFGDTSFVVFKARLNAFTCGTPV